MLLRMCTRWGKGTYLRWLPKKVCDVLDALPREARSLARLVLGVLKARGACWDRQGPIRGTLKTVHWVLLLVAWWRASSSGSDLWISDEERLPTLRPLGTLLENFLRFYATFEFERCRIDALGVSPFECRPAGSTEGKMWLLDPLSHCHNLAKKIDAKSLESLRRVVTQCCIEFASPSHIEARSNFPPVLALPMSFHSNIADCSTMMCLFLMCEDRSQGLFQHASTLVRKLLGTHKTIEDDFWEAGISASLVSHGGHAWGQHPVKRIVISEGKYVGLQAFGVGASVEKRNRAARLALAVAARVHDGCSNVVEDPTGDCFFLGLVRLAQQHLCSLPSVEGDFAAVGHVSCLAILNSLAGPSSMILDADEADFQEYTFLCSDALEPPAAKPLPQQIPGPPSRPAQREVDSDTPGRLATLPSAEAVANWSAKALDITRVDATSSPSMMEQLAAARRPPTKAVAEGLTTDALRNMISSDESQFTDFSGDVQNASGFDWGSNWAERSHTPEVRAYRAMLRKRTGELRRTAARERNPELLNDRTALQHPPITTTLLDTTPASLPSDILAGHGYDELWNIPWDSMTVAQYSINDAGQHAMRHGYEQFVDGVLHWDTPTLASFSSHSATRQVAGECYEQSCGGTLHWDPTAVATYPNENCFRREMGHAHERSNVETSFLPSSGAERLYTPEVKVHRAMLRHIDAEARRLARHN